MENKINYIIAHILSGEASLDEVLLLSGWLNQDERNKQAFTQIKRYWDAEVANNHMPNPDMLLKKIQQTILNQQHAAKRRQVRQMFLPAAAVALAIVISTLSLLYVHFKSQRNVAPEVQKYYTYLTNDNKSLFTLNDGTKITLNKHSSLTFTDKYGENNRYVKLDGEAYFEVTHNPASPFEVAFEIETKDDAFIKVLGTVFNVKIDVDEERITATLVEGAIRFDTQDRQITMEPNQQLKYTFANKHIDVKVVDAEKEVAWKDGLMKYKTIPFVKLMEELGQRYHTQILITNKQLTDPAVLVSGTFEDEESLDEILNVVARSLPFKWSKKGGVYYIK
jgi:ferric-dicitrate binding protein FerR (iron transport regulator)